MKNFKLINYLLIAASGLVFMQCTSDYTAIPGKDGIDGVDGVDGVDGIDGVGTQVCIDCHSTSHREGIYDAYYTAKHATGTSWDYAGKRGACASCHNNEGFIDYIETGAVAVADANGNSYGVANPLSCTGCHNVHTSFDFENDGNDFAVRTSEGVNLRVFAEDDNLPDYTIDYGTLSNLCVNCHQPRTGTPQADTNGKYMNTSTHWGPHHGPQSALLEGLLGAYSTFTLVEAIPAVKTAAHRTDTRACIECHMEGTSDGSYGHSWEPAGTNCAECHGTSDIEELVVTGFEDDMKVLGALLEQVVGQKIARASSSDPWLPVFEADGVTPVPQVGIVHLDEGDPNDPDDDEWHPVTGLFDIRDAEAAWNFLFLLEDKSHGRHNPNYAKSLIKNSIANLQN